MYLFLALLLAPIGSGQQASTAPTAAKPTAPAAAATPAAVPNFSADTPIETLLADPGAKAVLLGVFPGLDQHPSFEMFKTLSPRMLQPYSEGRMTDAQLATLDARLKVVRKAG